MSNNFWDDAVSKDGEKETTKEEKLDLSEPSSKSSKSNMVVFSNPLKIQIDFKEAHLELPKSNELTQEAIELIFSSKDCSNRFIRQFCLVVELELRCSTINLNC